MNVSPPTSSANSAPVTAMASRSTVAQHAPRPGAASTSPQTNSANAADGRGLHRVEIAERHAAEQRRRSAISAIAASHARMGAASALERRRRRGRPAIAHAPTAQHQEAAPPAASARVKDVLRVDDAVGCGRSRSPPSVCARSIASQSRISTSEGGTTTPSVLATRRAPRVCAPARRRAASRGAPCATSPSTLAPTEPFIGPSSAPSTMPASSGADARAAAAPLPARYSASATGSRSSSAPSARRAAAPGADRSRTG